MLDPVIQFHVTAALQSEQQEPADTRYLEQEPNKMQSRTLCQYIYAYWTSDTAVNTDVLAPGLRALPCGVDYMCSFFFHCISLIRIFTRKSQTTSGYSGAHVGGGKCGLSHRPSFISEGKLGNSGLG